MTENEILLIHMKPQKFLISHRHVFPAAQDKLDPKCFSFQWVKRDCDKIISLIDIFILGCVKGFFFFFLNGQVREIYQQKKVLVKTSLNIVWYSHFDTLKL